MTNAQLAALPVTMGASLMTCTSQALTANGSNTVDFPAWKIEVADPS